MGCNAIRMEDILDVYYSRDYPTKAEEKAVENVLEIIQKLYLKVDCITVFSDRIAAVLKSGDFLEYGYDQQTGELINLDQKDDYIKDWIQVCRSV